MREERLFPITSSESMIETIREYGIIPFGKSSIPGWSIQEKTHPDFWFTTSDELGPWDWKVDAVQEGIIYGKFLSRKAAFATGEWYAHLMNWRRSLPYFRMAEGEGGRARTIDERLQKYVSPVVLSAIRNAESMDSGEIRCLIESNVPLEVRKKIGGHVSRYLIPKVTKQAVDFVMQYLDMGTWTVTGDITRVHRGPNCEYKGWQKNTVTTPELLLSRTPFFGGEEVRAYEVNCSPEESREILVQHLLKFYPENEAAIRKVIG